MQNLSQLLLFTIVLIWACTGQAVAKTRCNAPTKATAIKVPGHPFSVATTQSGCWLFVSLRKAGGTAAIAVLHGKNRVFSLDHIVTLDGPGGGIALTHDNRVLAVTIDHGVALLNVARLESGDRDPLLTQLHTGRNGLSIYDAIGPRDRLLFVSDERAHRISVFDLAKARRGAHGSQLIGRIPVARAPVGLALSPNGRWLYATSERASRGSKLPNRCRSENNRGGMHPKGVLFRINVTRAASNPAKAVNAAVPVGCNPVRIAVSSSGKQLWVSARGDDALIRIKADDIAPDVNSVTLTRFKVRSSPVGVAIRPDDRQVWTALSARFDSKAAGQIAGITHISDHASSRILRVNAPGFPRNLIFYPDGRTLIATLYNSNKIEFIPTPR